MRTDELDYFLPEELIAQEPIEPRDAARLLIDRGPGLDPVDSTIAEFVNQIEPGDLIIVNETKVLPARVPVRRSTGGFGEVLLLAPRFEQIDFAWEALCRPSRKLRVGDVVNAAIGELAFEMASNLGEGRWLVVPQLDNSAVKGDDLLRALEVSGEMPLPPYISHRLDDGSRYQTMFAKRPASAAAPTAGLHFTERVVESLRSAGAELRSVELVVGLDTFRPLTTETVEDHQIHTEWYRVPEQTWTAVTETRSKGNRVIAVGTTSVRALESAAATGELSGDTALFIHPGYEFRGVDLILTNFHMPRTSLLAMIEAFVGSRWKDLYQHAIERRYRFLSFGDAMLLRHESAAQTGVGKPGPSEGPST